MWKYEEHPEDREEMELKANLLKLWEKTSEYENKELIEWWRTFSS